MHAHLARRFAMGLGLGSALCPVLLPALALAQPAYAGPAHESIGPVYPIIERDALQVLMGRMARQMTPQRLARWREHQTNQARARTLEPVPVAGLVRATQRVRRVFDPALDVPQAIQDADGRTVVPAGARVNPLAVLKLTRRLAFFDARDPEQVHAIERLLARDGTPIKPVAVGGAWLPLARRWNRPVYFDQQGILSARLQLGAVPALVFQEGLHLVVEEVPALELAKDPIRAVSRDASGESGRGMSR